MMRFFLMLWLFPSVLFAYTPPTGIPLPSLGVAIGNGVDTSIPSNPAQWPSAEAVGYYYVDNTATCTATGYGYPNLPRCGIPTSLAPGSVVEVHGGPYANNLSISFNGTEAQPIFLYGVGNPKLSGGTTDLKFTISGNYFVVDNIDTYGGRVLAFPATNAVIRNCDIDGHSTTLQLGLVMAGSNIVAYNNDVHHHQADDKHGITINQGSSNVWVLSNRLHHNGGDGLQFCHGCSASPPHHIYIGDNVAYSNRENGFDFKYGQYVVLSKNVARNHVESSADVEFCFDDGSGCVTATSGSDGAGIVVGSDGATRDIWVINNEVTNNGNGIRVEEAFGGYVIGNLVHNIPTNGIQLEKAGEGPVVVSHNTIANVGVGFNGPWQYGALLTVVSNNIFAECSANWLEYLNSTSSETADINNNLFYNARGSGTISMKGALNVSHTTGATIDSQVGEVGNIVGDPLFINSTSDFHLQSTSAAKDTGTIQALYAAFTSTFGTSIETDISGIPRPQNGLWDKGAYEYNTGYVPPVDVDAPVITQFSMPATGTSLWVPVAITATDNNAVSGYLLKENSTPPLVNDSAWVTVKPTTFSFSSIGSKTLYLWVKDSTGNISAMATATTTITEVTNDTELPVVTAFSVPETSTTLLVPVTLTATDNISVVAYQVTESPTKPGVTGDAWTITPTYTATSEGTKVLYGWAKDAAGNVSDSLSDSVIITLPQPQRHGVSLDGPGNASLGGSGSVTIGQ